jgi:hypothetical protein
MPYTIIQTPFTLKFREMPKPELKSYYAWFMQVLPERVVGLELALREAPSHGAWRADLTPDSLIPLGEWFASQVEVRKSTQEELDEIKAGLAFPIEVPEEELTNRTFSIAMDIGMYLSQVVLKNLPGTRWEHALQNKRHVDYGQPVLRGFGVVPMNPVRIAIVLARQLSSHTDTGAALRATYDTWAAKTS